MLTQALMDMARAKQCQKHRPQTGSPINNSETASYVTGLSSVASGHYVVTCARSRWGF